tara:strand:+ start:776 stop:2941 length:2166 start_codon:yes stop_codon:yes gene_type:complete
MAKGTTAKVTMVVDTKRPARNIGELTKLIQDMRKEIEGKDIGSEEFNELSRSIAEASGQLKDLERNMEGLDAQQKAEAFVKMGEGIAGGFAIGQGAMALFGTESEALQELQTRVQGAIAIAMGVRMLAEAALQAATAKRVIQEKLSILISGKGRLAALASSAANFVMTGSLGALTVAKGGATAAAIALRVAMLAIPIVAIVMGVMSLVSVLGDWFGSTDEGTESQQDFSAAADKASESVKKQTEALRSNADFHRQLANAETESEKELIRLNKALETNKAATDSVTDGAAKYAKSLAELGLNERQIQLLLDQAGFTKRIEELVDAEEATKDLIEAQQDLIEQEKQAERDREKAAQAYKERVKKEKQQLESISKLQEELTLLEEHDDDERNKKKIEFARQDALRKAEEITNEEIKRKTINAINEKYDQIEANRVKKIADDKKAKDKKEEEDAEERRKEIADKTHEETDAAIEEINRLKRTDRENELRDVGLHFKKLLEDEKLTDDERKMLREELTRQLKEIDDRYAEEKRAQDLELLQSQVDAVMDTLSQTLGAFSANMDAEIAEIDKRKRNELKLEGLTEAQKEKIEKDAEKKKKEVAKRQKKIAVAQAIIDTYKNATAAFGSMANIPIVGPVLGGIAATAAIAAGLANVKQIMAQDVGGGAGGGGGSTPPARPQPAKPSTTGSFSLGGADPNKKPVKAFVVTDEMTDSQQQLEGIRQESTL